MALIAIRPRLTVGSGVAGRRYSFAAFLAVCALCGGTYSGKAETLLVLMPVSALYLTYALMVLTSDQSRDLRLPVMALTAWALCMAIQLIPLPPSLWYSLPGRAMFRDTLALAQVADVWRPISLSPDSTLSCLIALLPITAAVIGVGGLDIEQRKAIPLAIIVIAFGSAVFGIAQMTIDPFGLHIAYHLDHGGLPIGLFSNRNHQALLFAIAIPSIRVWLLMRHPAVSFPGQVWLAGAMAGFMFVMVLATGSRSGFLLALVGVVASYLIGPKQSRMAAKPRATIATMVVGLAIVLAVSAWFYAQGRTESISRLGGIADLTREERFRTAPEIFNIAREFFPFGSGFGTFDQAYRIFEPDWSLQLTYLNQAHNDFLDLAMTGGLPALLAVATFVLWWLQRGRQVMWTGDSEPIELLTLSRLGWLIVLLLLLASLTDYPLRTPMMGVVFAIACVLLAAGRARSGRPSMIRLSS